MLSRLWALCCSLKLAIVLASLATALTMGGSLMMHFNPQVFSELDMLSLADWYRGYGADALLLTSWFYLTGLVCALLALNTACCFIDWVGHLRYRWRKTGEYLIHLGFTLVVIAYFWGSLAGDRRAGVALFPGELQPLPFNPGKFLRLDGIEPVIGAKGYPVDIRYRFKLLHGDSVIEEKTLQANTPLVVDDTYIIASGSGQQIYGIQVILPELGGSADLVAGATVPLRNGALLTVNDLEFDGPLAPLLHLTLRYDTKIAWDGWYSLRQRLPDILEQAGFRHVVRGPLQRSYCRLTINNDPGWHLALLGGTALGIGTLLALFSFYAKRRRGDRPEIP